LRLERNVGLEIAIIHAARKIKKAAGLEMTSRLSFHKSLAL
jgi:hypothetical protein